MLGKKGALEILEGILRETDKRGLKAEVHLLDARESTWRSAPSIGPHEVSNVRPGEIYGRVRDRFGRYAEFSLGSRHPSAIEAAIQSAEEALRVTERCSYLPLIPPQPDVLPEEALGLQTIPDGYWNDQERRNQAFALIAKTQRKLKWKVAGRFSTFATEIAVANSNGLRRYFAAPWSIFSLKALDPRRNVTLYASRISASPHDLDFEGAIQEVSDSADQVNGLPKYDLFRSARRKSAKRSERICGAILSPYAIEDIVSNFTKEVLNGYAVVTGESPLAKRQLGKMVTGEQFTISCDWRNPSLPPWPFDFEGVTRQTVPLITNGRFMGATYDGMAARKTGMATTGHSFFDLGTGFPVSVVMEGGNETIASLLAKSRGTIVVVNHFHYSALTYEGDFTYSAVVPGAVVYKNGRPVGVSGPLRVRFRPLDTFRTIWGMTESLPLGEGDAMYGIPLPFSFKVPGVGLRGVRFTPY